jgi:hypothetical protein
MPRAKRLGGLNTETDCRKVQPVTREYADRMWRGL